MKLFSVFKKLIARNYSQLLALLVIISIVLATSSQTLALTSNNGEDLFSNHCSGCHINGGNIIRRGKTLKLNSLKRNGLDNPEAIAKIAREGIGIMSGYEEVLGKGGDKSVAIWIWNQAQNAWTQG